MKEQENPDAVLEPCTVIGAMLATARMHRKQAERVVRSTGLHPTQHRVLMYLSYQKEPCKQKELADHFELTPAAVVQMLDKLESDGYVTREASECDARCKYVSLTEMGCETAMRSREAFHTIDASVLEGLGPEELRAFYQVLLRMQEKLKESGKEESET